MYTRLSLDGFGARRAGSFAGKGVYVPPVVVDEAVGGGKGSSRKKRVIYERIEDVEDFVETMESKVLQEPKVKAKLRKVKKLKPETVENTEESANAWIEYYDDLLQALRDQERAEQIRRDFEKSANMLQNILRNRELHDLMRIEAKRRKESMLLLLMAA